MAAKTLHTPLRDENDRWVGVGTLLERLPPQSPKNGLGGDFSQAPDPFPIDNGLSQSERDWLTARAALAGADPITHLWQCFDLAYPTVWRASFRSTGKDQITQWKQLWARTLARQGFSPDDLLRAGIEQLFIDFPDYPPSLGALVRWLRQRVCAGPELDPERAFYEAIENLRLREEGRDRWSHPAIYWAAVDIGAFDLRNATWDQIKRRWTATLQARLAEESLPEVPPARKQIPAPGKTEPTRENVKKYLEEIKKMLDKTPGMGI